MIKKKVLGLLPTKYGKLKIIIYQFSDGTEHLALYSNLNKKPLVRIQSECLTGETFGSERCDCGNQLNDALKTIGKEGGLLIYLRQEGRGIGLFDKIKAYDLQDGGLNTYEANTIQGLSEDSRTFSYATEILRDLKINSIKLLTNNPDKINSLKKSGIKVQSENTQVHLNHINGHYLLSKVGHARQDINLPKTDEFFMELAIEEAKKGLGKTSPNPPVGAVLVKNKKVIAKGYHECYGCAHAEINALTKGKGDILYVTLEPCSHQGKTGPCTKEIIKSQIKKVVMGIKDPNPIIKGIETLNKNRIKTEIIKNKTISEHLGKLYSPYIKWTKTKMPFTTLKIALDSKNKISRKIITNDISLRHSHKNRGQADAILTSSNTIIHDNPQLNVRFVKGSSPKRIILDSKLKSSTKSKVFKDKNYLLFTTELANKSKLKKFKNVIQLKSKSGKLDLKEVFKEIGKRGIQNLIVECGPTLQSSLVKDKLIDRLHIYQSTEKEDINGLKISNEIKKLIPKEPTAQFSFDTFKEVYLK